MLGDVKSASLWGNQVAGAGAFSSIGMRPFPPCTLFPLAQPIPLLPHPSPWCHKGSAGGRFLTVGGNDQYFGAASYAAKGVLSAGCDMSSIYTPSDGAALPLRCSPLISGEVMVFSPGTLTLKENKGLILGLDGVCVGCGIGRSSKEQSAMSSAFDFIVEALAEAEKSVGVLLDADALWVGEGGEKPPAVEAFGNSEAHTVVATPNVVEFDRLLRAYLPSEAAAGVKALDMSVQERGSKGVAVSSRLQCCSLQ